MGVHMVSFAFLFLCAFGALVVLAVVALVLFLLLRRKKEPRGFEVITKK